MSSAPPGACPSCGIAGAVGDACPERVCRRLAVHFIPCEFAKAHWEVASVEREALVGQLVGDFLVLGGVGRGGFGRILLALQRPLYRLRAALKLLDISGREVATARRVIEKFENEAAVLAVLNHPNIVRLLHYGTHQQSPYLAMEFVPGGQTLQRVMNRLIVDRTTLDPAIIKHVLDQILNGLEAAHEQHIIHRDIKPENIMLHEVVGNAHHVKLLDFGIAKIIERGRDTSVVMGTVRYMAPEQIEARNLGPWTDLYALGCIAFELMTGRRPFDADDPQTILTQKIAEGYDPFAQLKAAPVDPAVVTFLRRALARKPADRYQSTQELRTALDDLYRSAPSGVALAPDLGALIDPEELGRMKAEQKAHEARQRLRTVEPGPLGGATETDVNARSHRHPDDTEPDDPAPSSVALLADRAPGLDTGIPDAHAQAARASARSRRSRWLWLAAIAVLAGGTAVVAGLDAGPAADPVEGPSLASGATTPDVIDAGPAPGKVEPAESRAVPAPETPVAPDTHHAAEATVAAAPDAAPVEVESLGMEMRVVRLESAPPAAVWLNDEAQGKTPFAVSWETGAPTPRVRLVANGYRPLDVQLTPADIERGKRVVRLQRIQREPELRLQGKEW